MVAQRRLPPRDIVGRVLLGEQSVTELADRYAMSFAAVQKHVTVLERAGLVTKHSHGRERLVRGDLKNIRRVRALLDRYEQLWRARIDRLDALLAEPEEHEA
jgi:DNA-binding transcriptional ArsR family regulator